MSLIEIDVVRNGLVGVFVLVAFVAFSTNAQNSNARNNPDLEIDTDFGDRVFEFDFPTFKVGIAEYPAGKTGATVIAFNDFANVAMDVRGGSPGFVGNYAVVDAITMAGGSLLGLEAASGVAAGILAEREYSTDWWDIPLVSGGVIFDYRLRDNSIYPDKRLGMAAFESRVTNKFPLGARGAGISATVGKLQVVQLGEPAGQGAAYREIGDVKIFACVVLNAVGVIVDRQGSVVLGEREVEASQRGQHLMKMEKPVGTTDLLDGPEPGNTTLTVVVTNQTIAGHNLAQLGRQVHSSMARAIQPIHAPTDGDVLWMVSTREDGELSMSLTNLGIAASSVAWDAVLTAHP